MLFYTLKAIMFRPAMERVTEMNGNLAYQEEPREEIIGGNVVMMSAPTINHSRVAGNIYYLFRQYLEGRPCEPFEDGTALYLEEGREEYQPDMMVVCDPEKVKDDGVYGAPDLLVEVLSPGTGRYDRGHKKDVYEKCGVREYWIADPANRTVEQYVLENGAFVLRDVYALCPDFMLRRMKPEERAALATSFSCAVFEDLTISLERVFRRVAPVV